MARSATVLLVVVALLLAPVAVGVAFDDGPDGEDLQLAGSIAAQEDQLSSAEHADIPSVDHEVEVVVEFDRGTQNIPRPESFAVERVYTREGERLMQGSAPLSTVQLLSEHPMTRSIRITSRGPMADDPVSAGVDTIGAGSFHARNVTGRNVTVGIIDSDFRVSHPDIAGNVGAFRSFSRGGDWRHGTAVASVVADTAPGARLHLAAVGSTTTTDEYRRAVEWLKGNGADVIVDAGSYYGQPGDGSGEIASIAANASNDTVFVTSVGNHAKRYWRGNHSGPGYVTFEAGDVQGNWLADGEAFSGPVDVSLRWEQDRANVDYDLVLMRDRPGQDAVVERATGHDGRPYEYLHADVPEGRYYVAVRTGDATPNATRLELFANRDLAYRSSGGRTAPATAEGVLSVGASRNGSVRPFSAHDPDLVAPDTVDVRGISVEGGTSFAAPYVAGVAALVLQENPEISPRDVRALLRMTATDIEEPGVDSLSGRGRLNAAAIDDLLEGVRSGNAVAESR